MLVNNYASMKIAQASASKNRKPCAPLSQTPLKTTNPLEQNPHYRGYVFEHFNSRKLPGLLVSILSHFCTLQKINVEPTLQKIINSPSLSLLVSHMKMYNQAVCLRENCTIQKYNKNPYKRSIFTNRQKHCFSTNFNIRVSQSKDNQFNEQKKKIMGKRLNTQQNYNPKQPIENAINLVQLGCMSFKIYEMRMHDLGMFICELGQAGRRFEKQSGKGIWFVEATMAQMEKISQIILEKSMNIQLCLEKQAKVIINLQQSKDFNEDKYYNLKNFSKQMLQRIKQIQQRYTNMSLQILARMKKYKQYKCYIESLKSFSIQSEIQQKITETKIKCENTPLEPIQQNTITESQNQSQPRGEDEAFLQNMHNSFKSILKTSNMNVISKLVQARNKTKNKDKRISIQIMTDFAEMNKLADKYLHRQAVNIGSGNTLQKNRKNIKGNGRKQVKIQGESDQKSSNSSKSKGSKNSENSKFNTEKTKRKSRFSCVTKRDTSESSGSSCFDRFYSYQEIVSNRNLSQSSKSKTNSIKNQSKKTLVRSNKKPNKVQQQVRSKSMCVIANTLKSKKSKKMSQQKFQIGASLRETIEFAILQKAKNKKNSRAKRVGTKQQTQQIESDEQVQGTNQKKIKIIKTKFNGRSLNKDREKQKYEMIIQDGKGQNKEKTVENNIENRQSQKETPQIRSNRRIGMMDKSKLYKKKQSKIYFQKKPTKNSSQISQMTISGGGSKKNYISATRIKFDDNKENYGEDKVKMRTQGNQYSLAPLYSKVELNNKFQILKNCVKFYQNVECSLYKTTKKNEKQLFGSNSQNDKQPFEFASIPNFKVNKQCSNSFLAEQSKQMQIKRRLFDEQSRKLKFSKLTVSNFNQLQQRQMKQYSQNIKISPKVIQRQKDNNYFQTRINNFQTVF